jgi:hypothetical protein
MIVIEPSTGNIHIADDLFFARCGISVGTDWRMGWTADEATGDGYAYHEPPPRTVRDLRMRACYTCLGAP